MTRDDASDEIVLYTHPMSRGRIARWMLEETGQPYRAEILGFGASMKGPGYTAINPMGKVPAVTHRGVVITECAAICAYLADAFPDAGLVPAPGSPERGTYYRWLFFGAGPVEAATTNRALGVVVPDDKQSFVGYGTYDTVLDTMEGALKTGPWLLGERFSAADVYLGSQLGWGLQFGTIEKRPGFEAYVGRLYSRPAAIRATAIDDALVAEQKVAQGA